MGLGFGLGAGAGVGVGDRVRVRGLMCAPREDDQLRALRQADRGEGRPRRRVEHTRGVARAAVDRKGRMRGRLEVAHLVSVALVGVALVGVAVVSVALVNVAVVGVAVVEGVEGLSEQRRARRECVKWCA